MTTDYSKLDTAALVAAADALIDGIRPGAWKWDTCVYNKKRKYQSCLLDETEHSIIEPDIINFDEPVIVIDDADAAFIAAAPALVRALVTRLREAVPANDGYKALAEYYDEVADYMPDAPQFNVGDQARIKYSGSEILAKAFADKALVTILERKYLPYQVIWRYKVTDGVTQLETVFADELERVEATNAAVPFPKFKVNDRVQLKSWDGDKFLDWKAGTILTVYGMMYYDQERRWSYDVGDDISQRSTPEYNLERFENG